MRTEKSLLVAAWLALFSSLCLLAGCPGELANKAEFEAYAAAHADAGAPAAMNAAGTSSGMAGSAVSDACGDVVTRVLVPTCGGTGCHGAVGPQQDLDLVSPGVATRLVGVPAKQCLQVLVDPQNPEQSLVYQKLLPKPACGAQMPLARPPLSGADVACVLAWITAQ
jgi:hypothetical protein